MTTLHLTLTWLPSVDYLRCVEGGGDDAIHVCIWQTNVRFSLEKQTMHGNDWYLLLPITLNLYHTGHGNVISSVMLNLYHTGNGTVISAVMLNLYHTGHGTVISAVMLNLEDWSWYCDICSNVESVSQWSWYCDICSNGSYNGWLSTERSGQRQPIGSNQVPNYGLSKSLYTKSKPDTRLTVSRRK